MKFMTILSVAVFIFLAGCKEKVEGQKNGKVDGHEHEHGEHDGHNHDGHEHGPNGGELKNIGSIGKLEYILDESAGTMILHIFDKDGKTPVKISKTPQVIAKIDGKRKAVEFKSDSKPSSKFTLQDELLKAHMDLNILLTIDGTSTPFNIPIPHVHH